MGAEESSENYLFEQLLRQELLEVSVQISQRYSPVKPIEPPPNETHLSFSEQELQEVSKNISLYYSPKITLSTKKLVILPVDPQHLHVYWSLGDDQNQALTERLHEDKLTLRVFSKDKQNTQTVTSNTVFEMPVHNPQAKQRIRLPQIENAAVYSASIGTENADEHFEAILDSNHIHPFQGNMDASISAPFEQSEPQVTGDVENKALMNHSEGVFLHQQQNLAASNKQKTNQSAKGKKGE